MRRLLPIALLALAFLLVLVVARSGGAGIEMLQLALLGVVLLLVAARLRVLVRRRWAEAPPSYGRTSAAAARGEGRSTVR